MPRIGDPCQPLPGGNINCIYGCGWGSASCIDGVWQKSTADVCPLSSRDYKTSIHYLTTAEEESIARRLETLKIARYRYKPGLGSDAEHLGFIIEDVGEIPAVMADRKHVDLYGYASMLAVTVQTQARELRALREELRALRIEVVRHRPSHGGNSK